MQETQETQAPSLGQEKSSGGGNGKQCQNACLENPMDRGAWEGYNPWGHKESDTTKQRSTEHKDCNRLSTK